MQSATITDYLEWRGDLSFDVVPFNDVDNLVLAVLSYLDFTGIVPSAEEGGSIPLPEACRLLQEKVKGNIKPYVRSLAHVGEDYLQALACSRRFGNAMLSGYEDCFDEVRTVQFSAIRIDIPNLLTYISFRGTDSTLVGWREDFMLSFRLTEAQELSRQYVERAVRHRHPYPVVLGGHSKGGALAEYAAACSDDVTQRHIVHVYSNDGPGLDPRVAPKDIRTHLGSKLTLIVPTYSTVGMLYARDDEPRLVVESSERGAGQHDPTTWLVTPTGLRIAAGIAPDCKPVNAGLASWAVEIPLDERERIVNEVFDALGAGGAETIQDVTATAEGTQKVLAALDACDPKTKDAARKLVDSLVASSIDAATQSAKERAERWRRDTWEVLGTSARKLIANGKARALPQGEDRAASSVAPMGTDSHSFREKSHSAMKDAW